MDVPVCVSQDFSSLALLPFGPDNSCPLYCRMFRSNPCLKPMDAKSTPFLRCDKQKCLQTLPNVPRRAKALLVENHCLIHPPTGGHLGVSSFQLLWTKLLQTFMFKYNISFIASVTYNFPASEHFWWWGTHDFAKQLVLNLEAAMWFPPCSPHEGSPSTSSTVEDTVDDPISSSVWQCFKCQITLFLFSLFFHFPIKF